MVLDYVKVVMNGDEARAILEALKEQGDRSERMFNELANEIRGMSTTITKGFAQQNTLGGVRNGNAWPIATFTTVILALATFMAAELNNQGTIRDLQDANQKNIMVELDRTLQLEIVSVREVIQERVSALNESARLRHESQQQQIEKIESWFDKPKPQAVNQQ